LAGVALLEILRDRAEEEKGDQCGDERPGLAVGHEDTVEGAHDDAGSDGSRRHGEHRPAELFEQDQREDVDQAEHGPDADVDTAGQEDHGEAEGDEADLGQDLRQGGEVGRRREPGRRGDEVGGGHHQQQDGNDRFHPALAEQFGRRPLEGEAAVPRLAGEGEGVSAHL
jgi:hypothetical protein